MSLSRWSLQSKAEEMMTLDTDSRRKKKKVSKTIFMLNISIKAFIDWGHVNKFINIQDRRELEKI